MKFTLSWLKDHLDTGATLDEIATTLTRIGLEVEGIENPAEALAPFVVGEVVEAAQHPNADRLRVCQVNIGKDALVEVVCGAPNARAGLKTAFAAPGSVIPATGDVLKVGAIRGVTSNGMLCSTRELKLGEDHDGIMELPADAVPGQAIGPLLGLDDPVIETAVVSAEASTFWKLATLVESAVVWSVLPRLTVAAAFMTSVLTPVPPSIEVSVP